MEPNYHKLLKNLPQDAPDAAVTTQFEKQLQQEARTLSQKRHLQFYRWITRGSSLAACFALVLFLFMSRGNDSFAAMQQLIRQTDYMRVTIDMDLYVPLFDQNMRLSTTRSWINRQSGLCSDIDIMGKPALRLWHPWDGDTILINHIHQVATPIRVPADIDPSELLQFNPAQFIQRISQITGKPQQIDSDDEQTLCYRVDGSQIRLPKKTIVLIRIDRNSKRPKSISCELPMQDGTRLTWAANDFTWQPDPATTPSNVIPKHYKIAKPVTIPTPSLDSVATSLAVCAQLFNGQFPNKQTLPWQTASTMVMQIIQQPDQLKKANLNRTEIKGLANAIAGSIYLMRAQQSGAHITYHGKRVQLSDDDILLQITYPNGRIETLNGKLQKQVSQHEVK
ncbi:MAG: hypothetical protein ACF8OB_12550 [Phycisphaeraceae bacterium JB051]